MSSNNLYYYRSEDIIAFPSTNSKDSGKITSEENLRDIVTRITELSYRLYGLEISIQNSQLTISEGAANLKGYKVITTSDMTIDFSGLSNDDYYVYMSTNVDNITGNLSGDEYSLSSTNNEYRGIYLSYTNDESEITDDVFYLCKVTYSDNSLSSLELNPYINNRIDTDTILVNLDGTPSRDYHGIYNIKDFVSLTDDIYVSKFGDTIYKDLYFKNMDYSPNYTDEYPPNEHKGSLSVTQTNRGLVLSSIAGDYRLDLGTVNLDAPGYSYQSHYNGISFRKSTDYMYFTMNGLGETNLYVSNRLDIHSVGPNSRHKYLTLQGHNINIGLCRDTNSIFSSYDNDLLRIAYSGNVPHYINNSIDITFSRRDDNLEDTNYYPNINYCNIFSIYRNFITNFDSDNKPITIVGTLNFNVSQTNDGSIGLYKRADGLHISGNTIVDGTVRATKVYNAVYNDYADFVKKDKYKTYEPGDIIAKKRGSNEYTIATYEDRRLVVGVYSDNYGHILGGEDLENMEDNKENYIPLGVAGNVDVKVVGIVNEGDLITVSRYPGVGERVTSIYNSIGCIVGKALESKTSAGISKIKMQIMLN